MGKDEGEKRSKITLHFTGDIERYKPRSRVWTKEERVANLRAKWRMPKEKVFTAVAFLILFLVAFWLILASMGSGLDSSLVVVAIIILMIVIAGAIFFVDMMFFETE